MKKNWLLGLLVVLAFLFALVAAVMMFHHIMAAKHPGEPTGMSDVGVLVTILGSMITFVVGFQIYNSLDARDTLVEIGELKTVKAELDHFKGEVKAELKQDLGGFMANMGEYMAAVFAYMEGLYFSIAIDNETRAGDNVRKALAIVDGCGDLCQTADSNKLNVETARQNAIRWIDKVTAEFGDKQLCKRYETKIAHIRQRLDEVGTSTAK